MPSHFDLLSIDLDGNDYWIWKAISDRFRPRVVVVEYNANVNPAAPLSIQYDPSFKWDGSSYYGASLGALKKLGESMGYQLIGCESSGTNAFFVEKSLAKGRLVQHDLLDLYRAPIYGPHKNGYRKDPRRSMIPV